MRLVSSLYDSYILVEDGRLYESIRREFEGFTLNRTLELTHSSSSKQVEELLAAGRHSDLTMTTLGDVVCVDLDHPGMHVLGILKDLEIVGVTAGHLTLSSGAVYAVRH